MSEWHDYSENNISFCQICKDLYDANKNEDAQIEDYHMIEPLTKGKKRSMTATLSDFKKGAKLRLNKDYKGNSQLGAFDLDSDSDDDKKTTTSSPKVTSTPKTSSSTKKKGVTASLSDFAKGAKLRLNKDYKGNSQLGAFDLDSDSDDDKKTTTSSPKVTSSPKTQKNTLSKGGRRRRTHSKKRRSATKKRRSHSKKRRTNKK